MSGVGGLSLLAWPFLPPNGRISVLKAKVTGMSGAEHVRVALAREAQREALWHRSGTYQQPQAAELQAACWHGERMLM